MFTGLVQSQGLLYPAGGTEVRLYCPQSHQGPHPILSDMALGDSIAVDGVCLTVAQSLPQGFLAAVSPETLRKTTLGSLPEGTAVNLEVSLRANGKIGGHFVTGHIDGIGTVDSVLETANAWEIKVTAAPAVARYVVPKGSIAVNGISLTVAECSHSGDWFTVAVIPTTYYETTLSKLTVGQPVNLEGDILGKYTEKLLRSHLDQGALSPSNSISLDFLTDNGY